ncbi:MAG: DEAD/DEAH box helicase [Bacteroidales bacterium]|nr:DEAD/DEAH box helicase [Bacteroidales bacterium]
MMTFQELGVNPQILKAIEEMGFEKPMPVQEAVIPKLLDNGGDANHDLIALAQTGTGKTAAFGIPLLQRIKVQQRSTQALVLAPTRELCLQIADDIRDFGKFMTEINICAVYGGTSLEPQIRQLKKGAQIVVATPGRLIDLMERKCADLTDVKTVVLDEADEMLNMGFSESIDTILGSIREQKDKAAEMPDEENIGIRLLLFSATMSREIERIAKSYLSDYQEIVVGSRNDGAEHVNHIYYMVNAKDKYLALKRIVDYNPKIYAIVFCRTKLETQEIADKLIRDGYNAESLHGDLSQQQRDLTMQKFRNHLTQLLVATDVAARGLDVEELSHVINYGLPDDIESYTHRSGRTGRAGRKGTSIAIIHTRERSKMRNIEKEIGKQFVAGEIPTPQEICKKQLYKVMDQIVKTDVDEDQIAPFMQDINRYFEYIDKEDVIKKIVAMQFGHFLSYYKNAPEIEKPVVEKQKGKARDNKHTSGKPNGKVYPAEKGFAKLFINLGKMDGFYPGEVMQFLNKNMRGRQAVGHIELLRNISYIEVPESDAARVMAALNGTYYKNREVRCNRADQPQQGGRKVENVEKAAKVKKVKKVKNGEKAEKVKKVKKAVKARKVKAFDFGFDADLPEGHARRKPKKK